MHIRSRAPLRISFAGGGTDVSPFPETEGGLVLSATISQFAYGTLSPRQDAQIRVESADLALTATFGLGDDLRATGELRLMQAAIARLGNRYAGGYDLFLRSSAPPGSGLGSSSTVMVALVGLLREYHKYPLTEYEVAHIAYQMEREDLQIVGGRQDHYAATFGGFNFIEFSGEEVLVNPLRVRSDTIHELEHNLLLAFTGTTRESSQIIEDQTSRLVGGAGSTLEGLRAQKDLASQMKTCLLKGELATFGELLGAAWFEKQKMSPKISNDRIQELYDVAMKAGALGGKVTGAGGGGYMLLYSPFRRRSSVADALTKAGSQLSDVRFTSEGLTTWISRHE